MAAFTVETERQLFCACVELPAQDRSAWLDTACKGNTELRHRIERLLMAHDHAEQATLNPLEGLTEDEFPGTIDAYRLLRVIGEGGMGVVHEAQQTEPVRRRVALKALKPGMDSKQVLARFASERQALAAMDHPYVAKIFDAGRTASGRPYFVMEFVDGVSLLAYCDQNQLSLRQRIDLFVMVCQAVQHAHQKSVIHRDLKPSNVLVTSEPGAPVPKIIDFGIARAVVPEVLDASAALTLAGQRLGTPAYMSPEQAGWHSLDVDTRSDIYSLGVVLYELLTGYLPVDPGDTSCLDFLSRLGRGELECARPSSRAAAGTAENARRRGVTPAELKRQLAGDLDSILTKALEIDRERRYDTVIALAQDLERYTRNQPVIARAPRLSYRAGRFMRRHRLQVAAAMVTAAAILGGAAAATSGYMTAKRAEAAAREEALTAGEVSDFLVRLFGTADPNAVPGNPATVKDLLERGAAKVEKELKTQPRVQARLLGTLSHVYESIGMYRQSKVLAEKSLAVAPHTADLNTAELLVSLGRVRHRLGEFDAARKALERALDIRVRILGEHHLDVAMILNLLGGLYGQLEKFDDAIVAHKRALAIQQQLAGPDHIATYNSWRGLGMVQDRQGHHEAALESFRRVLPIAEKRYGKSHPIVADALNNIAMVLARLNQPAASQELYERALEMRRRVLGPDHPSVAFSANGLAKVLYDQGRWKEALPFAAEAVRIRESALGPENVRTGEALEMLGLLRLHLGQFAEARQLFRRSLRLLEQAYGPDHTDTIESRRTIALAYVKAGRDEEALPHLREIVFRDLPPRLRIHLEDPMFDRMRGLAAFQELQTKAAVQTFHRTR